MDESVVRSLPRPRRDAVFFDPSGRRWRRVRLGFAVAALLVLALGSAASAGALQGMTEPPAAPKLEPAEIPPDVPVVGEGPMVRLVRTHHVGDGVDLVELDSGVRLRRARRAEAEEIGEAAFVVERYDRPSPPTPTLALTFDDGPDPVFTPRLLDLLAEHEARATFFVLGQQAARYPELVDRIVREGHLLGNHTVTHTNVAQAGDLRARAEIVATDRVLRAISGRGTTLFRPPYGGDDDTSDQRDALAYARAQRLGYQVASYDFDTNDWRYAPQGRSGTPPLPALDGRSQALLLHDAGGDRSATLIYVEDLLTRGAEAGYAFDTLEALAPSTEAAVTDAGAALLDHAVLMLVRATLVWPATLTGALFTTAVLSAIAIGLLNTVLAVGRRWRRRRQPVPVPGRHWPRATVLVAAYNEATVIGATLRALARSTVSDLEILVVDDGSTDGTADVVAAHAAADPRIRLLTRANAGKPTALNRGVQAARGEVIVTLDADTQFAPDTVAHLVGPFAEDPEGRLGAVAGVVKVGNRRNLLTRWQALEYLTQISIDRAAQDALGAIVIVPGACAAWRRSALLAAGGFSHDTLAEDCDLTLLLHRLGYRVRQEDDAVCYTEAPETVRALLKQRTRWVHGTVQALWKHRGLIGNPRFGALGLFLLPFAVLSIVMPLLFTPLLTALAVVTSLQEGPGVVLVALAIFSGAHALIASVGVLLARERPSHLLVIPLYRLIAEPMRIYLLSKSMSTALHGTRLGWNKLQRTATVTALRPATPFAVPGPGAPTSSRLRAASAEEVG